MQIRCHAALLIVALVLAAAPAFGQIQLQSRTIHPSTDTTAEFLKALRAAPGDALHGIAVFSRIPSDIERRELERIGIFVLAPFQGHSYRVRVAKRLHPRTLRSMALRVRLVVVSAEDRIAPALWREDYAKYVIRPPGEKPRNYVLTSDDALRLTVRMHRGVGEALSRVVLHKHALSYARRSNEIWEAVVARASLRPLAAVDAVQWIGPGPVPFMPENDRTRSEINVDALQTLVDPVTCQVNGVVGNGVQVGIFDQGMDDNHGDVVGRVIRKDIAREGAHATHEAATLAGSGVLSSGLDSENVSNGGAPCEWRGMAPRAELIDADREKGADPATHRDYIANLGMDVSNHSYPIGFDGDYDGDAIRDELIRGDGVSDGAQIPGRLQVTSAGNHGQAALLGGGQSGYFSLTKQVKNALVVGNWDRVEGEIDETSSLGPAHDGRIKPDVVAPGRTVASSPLEPGGGVKSAGFCWEDSPLPQCLDAAGFQRRNFYRLGRGTSMASAATTGVVALVLEQYAATYGVNLDLQPPLPSTLRGVMIHTARDKEASAPWAPENVDGAVKPGAGPDFVTGWGLIDAQAAVNSVANKQLVEGKLPTGCGVVNYLFTVPAGAIGSIRITLAWDDVAGDVAATVTAPKLVNDLDLVLIDPGGTTRYPWQLDQKIVDSAGNTIPDALQQCGTPIGVQRQFTPSTGVSDPLPAGGVPAATRGRDHLNNVEVVDAPAIAGTWMAQVSGFSVPQGPQSFSLIGQALRPFLIHPTSVCTLYPALCAVLRVRADLCERFPKVCATRISFPERDRVQIGFADLKQKIFMPLELICRYAVTCPCNPGALCQNVDLQLIATGTALRAAVYSSQGRLVKRDASVKSSTRLRFKTRPGERYFIVLGAGPGTRVDTNYDVRLQLN